ncbi:DUF1569 domain-containing protein [Tunicatimonas pelagia]|uniref:DUF1569 domain-containing protein n=1 Tax=Tunicatimonas pelagia TaxID=931531 RepID=UPI002665FDDA|nr:DUF1569 domain-containing protein [Tunicatimonas pelagia]WKN45024.1 DUF1569 domain-containing protein [Tunicatimonas pelagia]
MANNIFEKSITDSLINRVNQLTPTTPNQWGKMNVAQMLAHCNVTYEMTYENKHPKPNAFVKFMLKLFAKSTVVGSKPYKKNGQTAPQFIVKDAKDFGVEKERLVQYLKKTQELGEKHFHNRESHSFGRLTKEEWSAMFHKHLEHHLRQFGV